MNSIAYQRRMPGKLPAVVEKEIERELLREKAIVEDKRLPISGYNYSALRDRVGKKGIKVSVNMIIEQKAATNQQRMSDLLYEAESQTQQPALFAVDYREVHQILSPDFEEEGEGLGARIDRLGSETQITIDPIRRDEETGRAVRHRQYLGGVTLTFDEMVTLLEEFGPLAYDQHPCAICRGAAAPGQELCPACREKEANEERMAVYDLT